MSKRPSRTRGRRVLGATLLLIVVLAIVALPTYAAGGGKSVGATIGTTVTACTYHVTFTWNGYSGATAYLRVVYQDPGDQFATAAGATNVTVSGRNGTAQADIPVSTPLDLVSHNYYGRGTLYNKRNQVSSPEATSTTSITAYCP